MPICAISLSVEQSIYGGLYMYRINYNHNETDQNGMGMFCAVVLITLAGYRREGLNRTQMRSCCAQKFDSECVKANKSGYSIPFSCAWFCNDLCLN